MFHPSSDLCLALWVPLEQGREKTENKMLKKKKENTFKTFRNKQRLQPSAKNSSIVTLLKNSIYTKLGGINVSFVTSQRDEYPEIL